VRLSSSYVHPRVLGSTSNLPASMALTFAVSLIAVALLYVTLCRLELSAKRVRAQLRALRARAELGAGAVLDEGAPARRTLQEPRPARGSLAAPAGRGSA
jgi:hypothetical protein